jgi:anti-anti-sigma factor
MKIEQRELGDVTVLDVRGRLTMNDGHGLLKTQIDTLSERGRARVVLNVTELKYLDSACLGEIINAHISLSRRGGGLKLVGMPDHLRELLKLAGLQGIFETFTDEAAAARSFQAAR